ncbi:MAG: glutamate formimidoyltransferase [Acidobacteriota bacterium]|nr:glutamate formimidoyltransferase [Acidobacteriota bacterium]
MKIVECVPNVSEGRDRSVLDRIAEAAGGVDGAELLDVDPGAATNRTVFTIVGSPDAVAEAAFRLAETSLRLIDMRGHQGSHARMGAVDVVPFVPVGGGATMEDCISLAERVGRRLSEELDLPVYLYEHAARRPDRRSLADVRKGEYEALPDKLSDPHWAPDFGEARFNARAGATAVGARPFLVAYNVCLNTSDKRLAHEIALDIREQGRLARGRDGKILHDSDGNKKRRPGRHEAVRAVGWYIPEFGRAQVSINLTDFNVTPPHVVFETIRDEARRRGLRVTGSEIVGLVPLEAILQAGRFYLEQQGLSSGIPEPDIVSAARASLGLDDVKPFDPERTIIEYRLAPRAQDLRGLSLVEFSDELSRSSPAPGGGSVAALVGSLGAALASMVCGLTYRGAGSKPGTDRSKDAETETLGNRAQQLKDLLLRAVDEDTAAFDGIRAARRLPRKTDDQMAARERAIQDAVERAIIVPLTVVEAAAALAELARDVAAVGLEAAASDAGVAAWCARTAAEGAALNVRINLPELTDPAARRSLLERMNAGLVTARAAADATMSTVDATLEAPSA